MMDQAEKLRTMVNDYGDGSIVKTTNARVIAVTSGKGGVGKTNFTVNLAVELRKSNKSVVVIDTDFNMANVEVLFGVAPKYSLAEVIAGTRTMLEVLADGPMGIKFISAGRGVTDLLRVRDSHVKNMIKNFIMLDDLADIILIDTGPGVTASVTNFVKASMETIVITAPEPTSITDAYTMLKILRLDTVNVLPEIKVVVNRAETNEEGMEIFNKLNTVSKKFLSMDINFLGSIPYDPYLVKAVKRQEPVCIAYPNSKFSKSVESMCASILNSTGESTVLGQEKGFSGFMKRLVGIFNSD